MISKSLKVRIAGTIFFLIFLAILVGNVVVVIFWQKGVVRSEVDHAKNIMGLIWESPGGIKDPHSAMMTAQLTDTCRFIGSGCAGVLYYNGKDRHVSTGMEITSEIINFARTALLSRQPLVTVDRGKWGALFFGGRTVLIAQPVKIDNRYGAVVVALKLEPVYKKLREDRNTVLVYLFVNSLILFVVGFFRMVKLFVKPIERMVDISELYQTNEGVSFGGGSEQGELAKLALALNNMLRRIDSDKKKLQSNIVSLENANQKLLDTQKEMLRAEKLASVGRLSAGLAHEIGNPIGIVQGYIELLGRNDLTPEERLQFENRACSELDRVNRLIRQLLDFARTTTTAMAEVEIRTVLEELLQVLFFKENDGKIKFSLMGENDGFRVVGDENSIKQVFLNLLLNAVDGIDDNAQNHEGKIEIAIHRIADNESEKNMIETVIRDNGTGIEQNMLETIFDPFVTTKEPGKGTGLGLFVSHSIIEAHNGRIWVESEPGKGTSVHVILPEYEPGKTQTDK